MHCLFYNYISNTAPIDVHQGILTPHHLTLPGGGGRSQWCYALTGRSSRHEMSLSGVISGLSALATCDADVW